MPTTHRRLPALLLAALAGSTGLAANADPQAVATPGVAGVTLEPLSELDPDLRPQGLSAYAATGDAQHVAHLVTRGSRQAVLLNGQEVTKHRVIGRPGLMQWEWHAPRPNRPDEPRRGSYQLRDTLFSAPADGAPARLIYTATDDDQNQIVIANPADPAAAPTVIDLPAGQIASVHASPRGHHLFANIKTPAGAPTALINDALLDNVRLQIGEHATAYSPDDRYAAIVATHPGNRAEGQPDTHHLYINGVPGPAFQQINSSHPGLAYATPDGQPAFVYLARPVQPNGTPRESGHRVIVQRPDGTHVASAPHAIAESLRVSDDGTGIAFARLLPGDPHANPADRARGAVPDVEIVLNGDAVATLALDPRSAFHTHHPGFFKISPDGQRLALKIDQTDDNQRTTPRVVSLNANSAANGPEPGPTYDNVSNLTFGPDGTRLAYQALNDGNTFIVEAGPAGSPDAYEEYGPFRPTQLQFTGPGAGRLLFFAGKQNRQGQTLHAAYVDGEIHIPGAQTLLAVHPVSGLPVGEYTTHNFSSDGATDAAGESGLQIGDQRHPNLRVAPAQGDHAVVLHPGGEHFACTGSADGNDPRQTNRIVLNGLAIPNPEHQVRREMRHFVGFTPDGQHFLTFALIRGQIPDRTVRGTVLLDGRPLGHLYDNDSQAPIGAAHFNADGHFVFIAPINGTLTRVTIDPVAAASGAGDARGNDTP